MTLLQSSIVAGGATGGYQISRSLRFNSADSASLSRTPGTAGNQKTATWSGWVKKSGLNTAQGLFECYGGSGGLTSFFFDSNNVLNAQIYLTGPNYNTVWASSAVFRDVGAWYHIVFVLDTTQASAANYIKVYVNGVQQTMTLTNYGNAIPQNTNTFINSTNVHYIGRKEGANYFNGYATEEYLIDGQALTPSSFGETSATTGVWNPIAYTGTYGTNGFYINFSDNSNTTAATLGKDYSSNGNNYTPANFSVTAGAGNDSLVDTPTNYGTDTGIGGEVRGDYCTLNPLDKGSDVTTSNGNLDAVIVGPNGHSVRSTLSVSSGKWYWEFTNVNNQSCGVIQQQLKIVPSSGSLWPGSDGFGVGGSFAYRSDTGQKVTNSVNSTYGASFTTTDVIGCALDMDNGKIWWSKNGTWQASGDPAAGTNAAYTGLSGNFSPAWGYINPGANTLTTNFGQRAFAYTAPTGFKALVTQNLPTPTVGASSTTLANKYFDIALYTGNGNATQTVSGLNFQTDFLWTKSRSNAYSHVLYDVLRTFGIQKGITSNGTTTEGAFNDDATSGYVNSVNSTGFQVTKGTTGEYTNQNGVTYCVWNWKAGGAGVTNTAGSITSTVSANITAGFSVVTYTGTSGNATVGHGLGVVPKMMILKSRNQATNWPVYHSDLGNTKYLFLNTTNGATTDSTYWNNTTPTSSVFSIGTTTNNGSGYNWVAYCFAEIAGFSKIGAYNGNGSTDGTFVYCGFRPKFIMVKNTDTGTETWGIVDSSRDPYNVSFRRLYPNLSNAENTGDSTVVDLLSNGFKFRSTDAMSNASRSYIYMAFAESPFNYSRAR